jgi:peptidoglycan hydrolase-like amidase
MLAIFASVLVAGFAVTAQPVAAATGQCTDWDSRTQPPQTIAVYRVSEGFVERVDFKHYVINVVSSEWNVEQPALRRAGAVAVKQYAWFHVLKWRGGTYNGECFDVKDTTADQIYKAKAFDIIPDRVKKAVNSTWSWRLNRDGRFFMTGYRTGQKGMACAEDAGYRLMARSAAKCANKGWSAGRILRKYYTAQLTT